MLKKKLLLRPGMVLTIIEQIAKIKNKKETKTQIKLFVKTDNTQKNTAPSYFKQNKALN